MLKPESCQACDDELKSKILDLELIASWADLCDYWKVRDLCRIAEAELREELERNGFGPDQTSRGPVMLNRSR